MALNASKVETNNTGSQEPLEAGNYLARVVQVLDLGLQEQRPYQGQEKPPAHEIMITYELVSEFCKDEDGNDIEDKPRWISETFPLRHISAELAKSTKRLKALDPRNSSGGDFTQIIGMPCTVTVVQNEGKGKNSGKIYYNVGAVTPPMKGIPVPDLINDPLIFDLDFPDIDMFNKLPQWLQDKIKSNLNYSGSALQKILEGKAIQTSGETSDDYDDDVPY